MCANQWAVSETSCKERQWFGSALVRTGSSTCAARARATRWTGLMPMVASVELAAGDIGVERKRPLSAPISSNCSRATGPVDSKSEERVEPPQLLRESLWREKSKKQNPGL